ncbi:MAG: type II toxin-antitoxin system VapC family toxin [Rhodospirillaceae bacterium]|nr:type II toxin-antitoxin system VapC family toxin [Rhodospirillaceae bacterium]
MVLDASAVIAMIAAEPGGDEVETTLPGAFISTVNLAEVGARLSDAGMSDDLLDDILQIPGLRVLPFEREMAMDAVRLRRLSRSAGLSLGDRACLALARTLRLPVLTADRAWARLGLGVEIRLIR